MAGSKRKRSKRSYRRVVRRKRSGVRRGRRKGSKPTVGRVRGLFSPDVTLLKLRWSEQVQNNSGAVASSGTYCQYYRANSIWDPQYAVGGAVANGLSHYSEIYQSYVVLGCKFRIQFFNLSAYVRTVGYVCHTTASGVSGSMNWNNILSQPNSKSVLLGPVSSSKSSTTLSGYMSTGKVYGRSKQQVLSDPGFAALVNQNPASANQWFVTVFTSQADTFAANISWQMQLTFYVKFYDRENYIQS